MPIDQKYGRVSLENQRNIGDDEPVIVFRAQDRLLPKGQAMSKVIEKMRAGADPTPPIPGVLLTPGQWWHKLLELPEDDRLERIAIFMRALDGVQRVRRLADSEDMGLRAYSITADEIRGAVFGRGAS